MEIIRKRVWVLGVLMCLIGIVCAVESVRQKPAFKVTEEWMKSKAPSSVSEFTSLEAPSADQATYDALQPFGIVARDYRNGAKGYSVMLIASDRRESFHSPNVCLPAQGLVISNEKDETIQTKSHGPIKVTLAELQTPDQPGVTHYMAFLYRVQDKFIARSGNTTLVLTLAMFEGPIRGNFDQNTVFYRFISDDGRETKDEFLQFVADYMDAAHDSSGGFY